MKKTQKFYLKMMNDVRAIESVEVAVLIVAIIIVAYGAFKILGGSIADVVTDVAGKI